MIICIRDGDAVRFLEWSSIVDAPVTRGFTRDRMLRWLNRQYGEANADRHLRNVDRAEANGTSSMLDQKQTAEDAVAFNRAGPEELTLTYAAIVRHFVRGEALEWCVPGHLLSALSKWDRGGDNVYDAIDPFLLFAVEPGAGNVHVEVRCNVGDERDEFTVCAADTEADVRAKCEAMKASFARSVS